MPIETLSGIPGAFRAGDTVRFSVSETSYPATGWTLLFSMRGIGGNLSKAGVANGAAFTVTLTAAETATLSPGTFFGALTFTETATTEKTTQDTEIITVKPNLADTTTGPRRAAYVLARTALESLGSNKFSSVSFNGQSFTSANANDLMKIVNTLYAEALREDRMRGIGNAGGLVRISTRL